MVVVVGYALLLASVIGCLLLGWAVVLAGRLARVPAAAAATQVSMLKPLHGAEPLLANNLRSFLRQRGDTRHQLICGVYAADDPARAVAIELQAEAADTLAIVVDPRVHGRNPKVSNLINLVPHADHDLLVISDSDIAVGPDYVEALVAALTDPSVGVATCLYRGRGDAGLWSQLVAMGIDLQFLPSALIGLGTGLATPCMGSTMALRRDTLARIGGLEAVADKLADDHAIGVAVAAHGLKVAVADALVVHACNETSLAALVRHELRWNATVASIDRPGYLGSVVLHPLPLAILAGLLLGGKPMVVAAMVAALGVRAAMAWRISRLAGEWSGTMALIPLRDLLSFALFVASFFVRTVDWRGGQLTVDRPPLPASNKVPA